jgi:ribonuclease BN (tRNA processing enzyme)
LNIRILGSAPGKPVPGKNQACVWVASRNENILIDCGEGAAQQLMKFKLDKNEIDTIVISHMHPDHLTGIYMVLLMFYLNNRTQKLDIFLPEFEQQFRDSLNMFYLFQQKFPFDLQIKNINELDLKWIKPILNDHLEKYEPLIRESDLPNKMYSYSFILTEDNKKVIYTSDIHSLVSLKEDIPGTDLMILDSVHPEHDEVLNIIRNNNTKFILNHGLSAEIEKILPLIPRERYEFADEKLEIII